MIRELARQAVDEHSAIQVVDELAALACLLPPLHRVLEIGCKFGGTLWFWEQIAESDARIVGIDLLLNQVTAPLGKTQLVEGSSQDTELIPKVQELLGGDADFLFIDGDHGTEMVRSDYHLWGPLVRSGGVIAFHDVAEGGVKVFWDEMRCRHSAVTIKLSSPGWGTTGEPNYPGFGSRLGIGAVLL